MVSELAVTPIITDLEELVRRVYEVCSDESWMAARPMLIDMLGPLVPVAAEPEVDP